MVWPIRREPAIGTIADIRPWLIAAFGGDSFESWAWVYGALLLGKRYGAHFSGFLMGVLHRELDYNVHELSLRDPAALSSHSLIRLRDGVGSVCERRFECSMFAAQRCSQ